MPAKFVIALTGGRDLSDLRPSVQEQGVMFKNGDRVDLRLKNHAGVHSGVVVDKTSVLGFHYVVEFGMGLGRSRLLVSRDEITLASEPEVPDPRYDFSDLGV